MNQWKALARQPLAFIAARWADATRLHNLEREERLILAQGRQLADRVRDLKHPARLEDVEFRVFSQFGDDGILQYIVSHLAGIPRTFVEFGVEDYAESNTRFLLMNNNWSGFIMDGSAEHMTAVTSAYYYWRHELVARPAFITVENVNGLLAQRPFPDVGVLHIDVDGNDYWIWQAIDCIKPPVVIVEYNSVLGPERPVSVPYAADFRRTQAHFSNLYWGASLPALAHLASAKGYALIGSNSAGNNAYFIRTDCLNGFLVATPVAAGYRRSKYRESRDPSGALTYLMGDERLRALHGLPVINVETNTPEKL
jgi:hypothetical protein